MDDTATQMEQFLEAAGAALAAELRGERARLDISQDQLADRAGLHKNTVQRYERGVRDPGTQDLIALGIALGVPAGELLNRAQEKARQQTAGRDPEPLGHGNHLQG